MKSLVVILLTLVGLLGPTHAIAQPCPGQSLPLCNCTAPVDVDFTICIGAFNYIVTVTMCIQVPTGTDIFVENPVTTNCETRCFRPVNEVYWIKKICSPVPLPATLEQISSALYRSMDLCCNNWRAISIPTCDGVLGPCLPGSANAFSNVAVFPRCYQQVVQPGGGTCYTACLPCARYCAIERRYCNKPTPTHPEGECSSCEIARCTVGGTDDCRRPCDVLSPLTCEDIDGYDFQSCCEP